MRAIISSPHQGGFTLLELLLAMTLGALVIAGAGRFLSQSFSLARGQDETASVLTHSGRLSAKLGAALRSAQLKEGRADLFFLATEQGPTLLFTTQKGRELSLVGWTIFEDELYFLEDSPGELTFSEGDLPSSQLLVDRGAQRVAPSLRELDLLYFDGEAWHSSWDSRTTGELPQRLELSFASSQSSQRQVLMISLPQGGGISER